MGPSQNKRGGTEVGMHGGVGGTVTGDETARSWMDGTSNLHLPLRSPSPLRGIVRKYLPIVLKYDQITNIKEGW